MAAENADEGGLVGYLEKQALKNPVAFMGLLGKVLPLQVASETSSPLIIRWLPPQEPPHDQRHTGPLLRRLRHPR